MKKAKRKMPREKKLLLRRRKICQVLSSMGLAMQGYEDDVMADKKAKKAKKLKRG